jgi:transcriptional regulator with XRE-family HTH domain
MNISQRNILDKLRNIRKENKKTQEEVADFLGITKQAYFRYEKGTRRISLDNLLKITKYYNLDSDYFCLEVFE